MPGVWKLNKYMFTKIRNVKAQYPVKELMVIGGLMVIEAGCLQRRIMVFCALLILLWGRMGRALKKLGVFIRLTNLVDYRNSSLSI